MRALFDATEPITVEIEYQVTARLLGARTVIALVTPEGEVAFQSTDHQTRDAELPPGRYRTSCTIPGALLNGRMYVVEIGFDIPSGRMLAADAPVPFVRRGGRDRLRRGRLAGLVNPSSAGLPDRREVAFPVHPVPARDHDGRRSRSSTKKRPFAASAGTAPMMGSTCPTRSRRRSGKRASIAPLTNNPSA